MRLPRRFVLPAILLLAALFTTLPAPIAAQTPQVAVSADQAPLRERPDDSSRRIAQLGRGATFDLLETVDDDTGARWYRVSGGGREGWVSAELVVVIGEAPAPSSSGGLPPSADPTPPPARPFDVPEFRRGAESQQPEDAAAKEVPAESQTEEAPRSVSGTAITLGLTYGTSTSEGLYVPPPGFQAEGFEIGESIGMVGFHARLAFGSPMVRFFFRGSGAFGISNSVANRNLQGNILGEEINVVFPAKCGEDCIYAHWNATVGIELHAGYSGPYVYGGAGLLYDAIMVSLDNGETETLPGYTGLAYMAGVGIDIDLGGKLFSPFVELVTSPSFAGGDGELGGINVRNLTFGVSFGGGGG